MPLPASTQVDHFVHWWGKSCGGVHRLVLEVPLVGVGVHLLVVRFKGNADGFGGVDDRACYPRTARGIDKGVAVGEDTLRAVEIGISNQFKGILGCSVLQVIPVGDSTGITTTVFHGESPNRLR